MPALQFICPRKKLHEWGYPFYRQLNVLKKQSYGLLCFYANSKAPNLQTNDFIMSIQYRTYLEFTDFEVKLISILMVTKSNTFPDLIDPSLALCLFFSLSKAGSYSSELPSLLPVLSPSSHFLCLSKYCWVLCFRYFSEHRGWSSEQEWFGLCSLGAYSLVSDALNK